MKPEELPAVSPGESVACFPKGLHLGTAFAVQIRARILPFLPTQGLSSALEGRFLGHATHSSDGTAWLVESLDWLLLFVVLLGIQRNSFQFSKEIQLWLGGNIQTL